MTSCVFALLDRGVIEVFINREQLSQGMKNKGEGWAQAYPQTGTWTAQEMNAKELTMKANTCLLEAESKNDLLL